MVNVMSIQYILNKDVKYNKNFCLKNKQKISEISKRYYHLNKEKIAERRRKHYLINKERICRNSKEYRDKKRYMK